MSRCKICLLCGHRATGYSQQLSFGVQNAVSEQGHIFVKIAEQVPYHVKGNNYEYFKVAFELAKSMRFDAYIVPVSTIYQLMITTDRYQTEEEKEELSRKSIELIKSLDPDRTLLLEQSFEGFRSITKDNRPGMRECIRHLIHDHGYRKIAFISGPATSKGAKERESIYFEEMKEAGLDTPANLFARGSFNGKCREIIEEIIDEEPEAIACACDQIAITAYKAVQERGLMVGRDIAITGFDDILEACQVDPPLSTVHMTSYDLGYMAGYEAVRLAKGMPQKDVLQTGKFLNRGSCGETLVSLTDKFREHIRNYPAAKDKVIEELVNASYTKAEGATWEYFKNQMENFIKYAFFASMDKIENPDRRVNMFTNETISSIVLDPMAEGYFNLAGFQNAINAFMDALCAEIKDDEERSWLIEQSAHLHLRISRLYQYHYNIRLNELNNMEMHAMQIVDDALMSGEDLDKTYHYFMEELAKAGLNYVRLCVFNNPVYFNYEDKVVLPEDMFIRGSLLGSLILTDTKNDKPLSSRGLLDTLEEKEGLPDTITISGLIANNELGGFLIIDGDSISYDQQVILFLVTGFALKHLRMIAYQKEMVRLLNENNIMLTHQSQQDDLTGLFNRRGFLLTTDILIKNGIGKAAAVFYLDLDGLKQINDTHGHDVGDEAIKNTANILSSCFRSSDLLGRQGGDEFVAFSILAKEEDIKLIVNRIQDRMKTFNQEHDLLYTLSISIGYKTFIIDNDTAFELDHLMGEADEMLYEVKRKRKGSRRFEAEKER